MGTTETGATGPALEMLNPSLPGTRFFAPKARIVAEDGSPIQVAGRPVAADIVSARVTQTHHGVSQAALTLNNQRHDDAYRPVVPTWKYNALDAVTFGRRVRVEFRYGDEDWAPMQLARLTDLEFSFPSEGGSQLVLRGEDLLSLLKTKPSEDKRYRNVHELEIVNDVLTRSACGLSLAPAERDSFSETLTTVTHQKTQTYLQFIDSLAERLDYEVFVDFDDPTDRSSPVSFHFEPSRSFTLGGVVELAWNRDLVEFRPKFKVWDVYTDAVASGRNPRRRERFDEAAAAGEIDRDLHAAPGGPAPLNAIQARERFFADENHPEANTGAFDVTNLDRQRARLKAAAELRKSAREFLTADATTIGFARLRPGIHVNIQNLYAPFDGIYYVTRAVHTIDRTGYKTTCSLRRPGMLDPATYPGGGSR